MDDFEINTENILVNTTAIDSEDIIRKLGGLLYNNKYVKDTYVEAVLDREKVFPTGLQTTTIGMAIPHTDSNHVLISTIAIATLSTPVAFRAMDNADLEIPVNLVIMLAISDPRQVIKTLTKVISILEYESTIEAIINSKTKMDIKMAVSDHIRMMAKKNSMPTDDSIGH